MSYHIKGAQHRAAEMLSLKGIYLTDEERRKIIVRRIACPEGSSGIERVYQVADADGFNTIFETSEVK